jgi:hypothetical protein
VVNYSRLSRMKGPLPARGATRRHTRVTMAAAVNRGRRTSGIEVTRRVSSARAISRSNKPKSATPAQRAASRGSFCRDSPVIATDDVFRIQLLEMDGRQARSQRDAASGGYGQLVDL